MFKLVIEANKQTHSHEFADKQTAIAEALKIRKFDFAADAAVYHGDRMIAHISHCPTVEKGARWRA